MEQFLATLSSGLHWREQSLFLGTIVSASQPFKRFSHTLLQSRGSQTRCPTMTWQLCKVLLPGPTWNTFSAASHLRVQPIAAEPTFSVTVAQQNNQPYDAYDQLAPGLDRASGRR